MFLTERLRLVGRPTSGPPDATFHLGAALHRWWWRQNSSCCAERRGRETPIERGAEKAKASSLPRAFSRLLLPLSSFFPLLTPGLLVNRSGHLIDSYLQRTQTEKNSEGQGRGEQGGWVGGGGSFMFHSLFFPSNLCQSQRALFFSCVLSLSLLPPPPSLKIVQIKRGQQKSLQDRIFLL